MKAKGKILQWGNSLGIRLEKAEAVRAGLLPNEEAEIDIKRKISKAKDLLGRLPKKVDTAKALREIDEMFGE